MKIFKIEVEQDVAEIIENNARLKNMSVERFIAQILSRFTVPTHILDNEQVKKGYEETAHINLEWANL